MCPMDWPQTTLSTGENNESAIEAAGGIDLQLLGIGSDGHIAFNEPGSSLASRTRLKALTAETRRDNSRFFGSLDEVPKLAVTMGVGTILEARRILLLATGESKASAVRSFIEGPVTAQITASALQLHPSVTVMLDQAAAVGSNAENSTWKSKPCSASWNSATHGSFTSNFRDLVSSCAIWQMLRQAASRSVRGLPHHAVDRYSYRSLTGSSDVWEIWIRDEDSLPTAKQAYDAYQAHPEDPKYADAIPVARNIIKEKQQISQAAVKQVRKVEYRGPTNGLTSGKLPPLTLTLVILCIAVSLLSNFSRPRPDSKIGNEIVDKLSFVSRKGLHHQWPRYQPLHSREVRSGARSRQSFCMVTHCTWP